MKTSFLIISRHFAKLIFFHHFNLDKIGQGDQELIFPMFQHISQNKLVLTVLTLKTYLKVFKNIFC